MKKNFTHVAYHVAVITLSAAIAFFLPDAIKFIATKVLVYWALIENEELCHQATEIASAVVLIVLLNALVKDWMLRKRSRMAGDAGLIAVASPAAVITGRRLKKLREEQGFGRNVMIIGSTGFRTFAEPSGHLHRVVRNCREAKIMLLDPQGEGVVARARSLADPEITPEILRDQLRKSIMYLKGLKALQKNVRLKLYPDAPLVKLCVIGDYLCLQHYPAGANVRMTNEYVFKHERKDNLFSLFYAYFVNRWCDPRIPEYDLDLDMLVYRDRTGNEMRRERLSEITTGV